VRRLAAISAAVLILLAGLLLGARHLAVRGLESLIHVHPQGSRTPATVGLRYDALEVKSGPRTLRAFFVPAGDPRAPALLVYHGNGESISSWVPALRVLHDGGVSAMVFDYSGFGKSDGAATLENLLADGIAAWESFRSRVPAEARACAYGLSLGTAIVVADAPRLSPPPDCVALSGAFTSAREVAVRFGRVPAWAAWILPDVLDTERGAALLSPPLLVEHGDKDELFPVEMAQRIAARKPGARLAIVPGMRHADPVARPTEREWRPVIDFVSGRR
jgi:alpha-beta hydrolase superfamily lysophospholipase